MDKKERLIIGLVSIEGTQGETIIEVSSIYPPTMKLAFLISLVMRFLSLILKILARQKVRKKVKTKYFGGTNE
ncbi:hypothetical protein EfmAA242_03330 [Enterococcus faecium]|nr:hypothetical protein EfmAA242_03330 [Enterococcus faecium]